MHKASFSLGETQLDKLTQQVRGYQEKLSDIVNKPEYSDPASSICLPDDDELLKTVQGVASHFDRSKLEVIVVVGIGGSNLGSKAIYDAKAGAFDTLDRRRTPRMVFAETTSATWLEHFKLTAAQLSTVDQVAICFISKSGTTTETVANFEVVTEILTQQLGAVSARTIAITDEGSQLWQAAEIHGWHRASIPAPVGGRYSVFSAVGLIPLALAGFDVVELRIGAIEGRSSALNSDSDTTRSAAMIAHAATHGRPIHDLFVFNPELESVGKWYRQLLAESLGKRVSRNDQEVWAGLTPTVSIGSTDLHSVGQLYFEGPRDKITTFLRANSEPPLPIPAGRHVPELASIIDGRSIHEIQSAIFAGTTAAYTNSQMPFRSIELPDLTERSLGALLQSMMIEVMLTAELLNVNAFDQPGVESYKKETKRVLEATTVSPL